MTWPIACIIMTGEVCLTVFAMWLAWILLMPNEGDK